MMSQDETQNGDEGRNQNAEGVPSRTEASAPVKGEAKDEAARVSRNHLLKNAVRLFAGAWGAVTLYPVYLYLKPPKEASDEGQVASVELGAASALGPGTGKNFKFGSTPGIITCTSDGEYHAFSAICTHLGCTVQFRADKQEIWCACHGGCYDAATGKNIAGPPPKPLKPLKVQVVDGKIVVSRT